MIGLESFLPEKPEPVTEEKIRETLGMFLLESFRKNLGYTKDQHIDYAAQGTAIFLNIDDDDVKRLNPSPR